MHILHTLALLLLLNLAPRLNQRPLLKALEAAAGTGGRPASLVEQTRQGRLWTLRMHSREGWRSTSALIIEWLHR